MFSRRLYRFFKLLVRYSHRFGAAPYIFDEHSPNPISVDPSVIPSIGLNYKLIMIWILLLVIPILKFYWLREWAKCYLIFTYWLGWISATSVFTIMRLFNRDVCITMNGTFGLFHYLHRNFMSDFNPERNKLNFIIEGVILSISGGLFLVTCLLSGVCILNPRWILFLGGLIPEQYFYIWVRILVTSFHCYLIISLSFSLALTSACILIYELYLTVFLTNELKLGRPHHKYLTRKTLRKSHNLRLVYRSFQVLNANAMCKFGYYLIFLSGAHTLLPILYNFGLIRFWNSLDLLVKLQLISASCILSSGWSILCVAGNFQFVKGRKVLRSWGKGKHLNAWSTKREGVVMKKFTKSCKLIMISHGSQFVMGRLTLLNYFKGVSRGTCRALLTTKTMN